ncbi:MAG: hypothetical protein WCO60_10910 [Verrucomicrobiota bacterium]
MAPIRDEAEDFGPQLKIPTGASLREVRQLVLEFRAKFDQMLKFLKDPSEAPAFLEEHIWRCLPRDRGELVSLIECLRGIYSMRRLHEPVNAVTEIQILLYAKLASVVCTQNPWRFTKRTLLLTEELQQLWPLWEAKLTRAIRLSFCEQATPRKAGMILRKLEKMMRESFGLKICWAVAKHEKEWKWNKQGLTGWHAHGVIWPVEGEGIHRTTFARRIKRLQEYLIQQNVKQEIQGQHIKPIRKIAEYINYIGRNLDRGKKHRKQPKEKSKGVKLYGVPELLSERLTEVVKWKKARSPSRPTPFYKRYHEERAKLASKKGMSPDDPDLKFTKAEGALIYNRLKEMPATDLPAAPIVRGRDGHSYLVEAFITGRSGEPIYFHLIRQVQLTDSGEVVPDEMNGAAFECTLPDLARLAQQNITDRAPIRDDIHPLTGRPFGTANENFINTILRGKILGQLDHENWIKRHSGARPASD